MRWLKPTVVMAAMLIIGAAAAKVWQAHRAYHLAVVQPGVLYRDGAKSESQFAAALDEVHPKTVVSLIDAAEQSDPSKPQFAAESKLCDSHGVKLERIEVKLGGWPTSENIQRFLAIVTDKQNQPVLVHCAQGVRRTGFFVAAYQESVLGYDRTKAKEAILSFGHSDNTVNDIRRFIDGYDPKTQSVALK
jgi:protein tyrosine/serine phosphatase